MTVVHFSFFCLSRGAFADGWFRQLEPLVSWQDSPVHYSETSFLESESFLSAGGGGGGGGSGT